MTSLEYFSTSHFCHLANLYLHRLRLPPLLSFICPKFYYWATIFIVLQLLLNIIIITIIFFKGDNITYKNNNTVDYDDRTIKMKTLWSGYLLYEQENCFYSWCHTIVSIVCALIKSKKTIPMLEDLIGLCLSKNKST